MRTLSVLAVVVLVLIGPASIAAAAQPAVGITVDRDRITAKVGQVVTVETRLTNPGAAPTGPLVAHVNVASVDGVYVDLEDWSADVTRSLATLPAQGATLRWQLQAVNQGTFEVYVVVLPEQGPLIAGPATRVTVIGRRPLDAGGALPVVIVVPVLLGLLAGATRYRLRAPSRS